MQESGGGEESDCVKVTRRVRRHLRAMCVSVKESEETNDEDARPERKFLGRNHHAAENEDGREDDCFNDRFAEEAHPHKQSAEKAGDERGRQDPEGATAHLRGEKTDGERRQQMVQTHHWMRHSRQQPLRFDVAGVSLCNER